MDFSKLSDEELEKIASGGQSANKFESMSDEELEAIASGGKPKKLSMESEEPGYLSRVGSAVGDLAQTSLGMKPQSLERQDQSFPEKLWSAAEDIGGGVAKTAATVLEPAAEAWEKYLTAPARAAAGEVYLGKNKESGTPIIRGLKAAYNQFGEDPALAPAPKEFSEKLNLSDKRLLPEDWYSESGEGFKLKKGGIADISPASIAEFVAGAAIDPTALIGLGEAASLAKQGVKEIAPTVAKAGSKAIDLSIDAAESVAAEAARRAGNIPIAGAPIARMTDKLGDVYETVKSKKAPLKRAENWEQIAEDARKLGLDPEKDLTLAHEFGKESEIERYGRRVADNPAYPELKQQHAASKEKLRTAIEDVVQKKAGGKVLNPIEAGNEFRRQAEKIRSGLVDEDTITYKAAIKDNPKMTVSDLAKKQAKAEIRAIKKELAELTRGAASGSAEAQEAIKAHVWIKDLEKIVNSGDMSALNNFRNSAFKVSRKGSPGAGIFKPVAKRLQNVSRETFIGSYGSHAGEGFADQLRKNNDRIRKSLDMLDEVEGDLALAPEKIPSKFFSDTEKAQTAKDLFKGNEKLYNQLAASQLYDVLPTSRGEVSTARLADKLSKENAVLRKIYGDEVIDQLEAGARLGEGYGLPGVSSSNTGEAVQTANQASTIIDALKAGTPVKYAIQKAGQALDKTYGKRGLERMIQEARGYAPEVNATPVPKKPNQGGFVTPDFLMNRTSRFLGYRDNPLEQAAKMSQINESLEDTTERRKKILEQYSKTKQESTPDQQRYYSPNEAADSWVNGRGWQK